MLKQKEEALVRRAKEMIRLKHEYRRVFEKIRKLAKQIGCEAYLYGSTVTGKSISASDIDILVVCEKLPSSMMERAKIKAWLEEKANLPPIHPYHIELVTKEYAKYYLKTISYKNHSSKELKQK